MTRILFFVLFVVVAALTLLTACSIATPVAAPAAPDLNIAILNPSTGQDTTYLVVELTGTDGAPITDATVALEGDMNHAGMVPVISDPVQDDADGSADGRYHVPFSFSMLGDWILTVNVTLADGTTASRAEPTVWTLSTTPP